MTAARWTDARWTDVDRALCELLLPSDPALDAALQASAAAGLPPIHVSPAQGQLLHLIARMQGARRILEIGTLGGYSAIWLARALPEGGQLVTLEHDAKHAAVARDNLARAGLSGVAQIRLGRAADSLAQLAAEGASAFDLVFIDADKPSYPDYLAGALRLARRGTAIIADNVVRSGAVIDPASPDPNVQGVRRFLEIVATDRRLRATAIQTVGQKGWDGFALVLVVS